MLTCGDFLENLCKYTPVVTLLITMVVQLLPLAVQCLLPKTIQNHNTEKTLLIIINL